MEDRGIAFDSLLIVNPKHAKNPIGAGVGT